MRFRGRIEAERSSLQLAPMIDIVFLLLIFFIVTWSFARFETELDVSVPAAEEGAPPNRRHDEQIVNVKEDGSIFLSGAKVTGEQLLAKCATVAAINKDVAVIVRGDAKTDFEHIIRVLDICRQANIYNIAFATARPTPATPPGPTP
jgi:biopolymer transport protein ExbD